MAIYAMRSPALKNCGTVEYYKKVKAFLTQSIQQDGKLRYGWGYFDLNVLKGKGWEQLSKDERNCLKASKFLLDIKKGDWAVFLNLPDWGQCIAGQVTETYSFDPKANEFDGDFKNLLTLDKNTIVTFDRNDDRVLPIISSRLKLQGHHWRIYDEAAFLQSIANFNNKDFAKQAGESKGVYYLKEDLSPILQQITAKIRETHPAGTLEELIANVFRKVPNVIDVIENGKHKGWGSDNGADLIVTYQSGLNAIDLGKEETLVVQIKSYRDNHWETNAVSQIETAVKEYKADAGLLITTAKSTPALEEAFENLADKLSKDEKGNDLSKPIPIRLIAGEDVAKFILQYGQDLLF